MTVQRVQNTADCGTVASALLQLYGDVMQGNPFPAKCGDGFARCHWLCVVGAATQMHDDADELLGTVVRAQHTHVAVMVTFGKTAPIFRDE